MSDGANQCGPDEAPLGAQHPQLTRAQVLRLGASFIAATALPATSAIAEEKMQTRPIPSSGQPLPVEFARQMRIWFILGWPAFLAVLAIFWLMVRKPVNGE